ncbi:MAG: efflux RND transporter periplasmic adaptor subunit [Firmicutes bacterium]|nr:efflux RND transporter periplasmic adaptor subunit [Bacillota bacterium]
MGILTKRKKVMQLMKIILAWGIIVTIILLFPLSLYASQQNASAADVDTLAQTVLYYNQRMVMASNRQFEINNRVQGITFRLNEATDADEIAEMREEQAKLNKELIASRNQLGILQARIDEIESQIANYTAQADVVVYPEIINDFETIYSEIAYSETVDPEIVSAEIVHPEIVHPTTVRSEETSSVSINSVLAATVGINVFPPGPELPSTATMALIIIVIFCIITAFAIKRLSRKRSKRYLLLKAAVAVVIVVSAGSFVVHNHANANPARHANSPQTFVLERVETKTRVITTSGVVQSSETVNIFSMQTNPVLEVLVDVGDRVSEGDILARLDMSRVERDIEQAELNLSSAITSVEEEARANNNAVTNAATSLEASRIALSRQQLNTANIAADLREAEENMNEPFDTSTFDRLIEDARTNVERRTTDVRNAEQDLREALYDFDDFIFVNNITEARVRLERSITALQDAIADLEEERNYRPEPFDAHVHQNNIDDAQRALDRSRQDRDAACEQVNDAEWRHFMVSSTPDASHAEVVAATNALNAARTQFENAERAVENAELNLERARTNLTRARDEYNRRTSEGRDNIVSALESAVDQAENLVDDARRAYERANSELERARENALEQTENHLNRVRDNLSDAIRAYERVLRDKETAMEDFIELNTNRLENAQRLYSDSQIQLQTAQNNLASAQNALSQARRRSVTSGTNVDIQQLNIERLQSQLDEGLIVATADGVITAVNARVGAAPSGVLFVIEDVDNLYVSANVREHSLIDLHIGQLGYVTTVATGNREFDAQLTFISPRAVSPAGSTSVEFEIRAAINDIDGDVRIGMNAFLNVVTDVRNNVFSIPLSAIVTNERGSFIYAIEHGELMEIMVTTGLRTSTHAEVFGDQLIEGLNIVLRPLDERGR